ERLLKRVQRVAFTQPSHGRNTAAGGARSQHETGADRFAIQEDRACPAHALAASLFDVERPKTVAQEF
ncbi:hypothetical protein Q8G49_30180, partial [Klebsiella pneumoniae]